MIALLIVTHFVWQPGWPVYRYDAIFLGAMLIQAVFLALGDTSVLLAASADSGVHAGNRVKAAMAEVGGRGGGNATLAQGSVPDASAMARVEALLQQGT